MEEKSNELAVVPVEAPSPITTQTVLIASNSQEMEVAQQSLINWCELKRSECEEETKELQTAYDKAKKSRWAYSHIGKALRRSKHRYNYYEKVTISAKNGYSIVPNFPGNVVAIKTNRDVPRHVAKSSGYGHHNVDHTQKAQKLSFMEGEYVSPLPMVREYETTDEEGKKKYHSYPTDFIAPELPLAFCKPRIMEAVSRAQMIGAFDEIAIFPGGREKGDPVVLGRVYDGSRSGTYSEKFVTFLICWWIDLKQI